MLFRSEEVLLGAVGGEGQGNEEDGGHLRRRGARAGKSRCRVVWGRKIGKEGMGRGEQGKWVESAKQVRI